MNLKGKSCLITGANSGLGFVTAKQFATQGADTIIVCRSKEKGEKAIMELTKLVPDASIKSITGDLSSLKSIQDLIKEIKAKYSKLDILYNNAAVMKQKRILTDDGFEMMFQVNYLAGFILMNSLLELLNKGSSPIIVNNGRPSDKLRLDMDDLQFSGGYNMYQSFFKTKLCLLFASLELSRKPESNGITVTMIDPGPFKSNLVRDIPIAGWIKNLFSAPVEKAAENIMYHIKNEDQSVKNGKIYREKQEYPLNEYWKNTGISERLWSITESMIKDKINY